MWVCVCVDGVFVWSCGVFFYVLFLNLSKLIIISCVSNSALHSLRLDKPQTKDRKRSRKIEHESDVCSQVTHLLFPYTQFIFVFIDFYRSFLLEICFFFVSTAHSNTRTHERAEEFCNWKIVFGIRLQNKTKLEESKKTTIQLRCFASMPMPIHFVIPLYRLTNIRAM